MERIFGRRRWLAGAALAAAALPGAAWLSAREERGLGGLRPDPRGVLDLLEGFTYRVIERSGARMSDGRVVPRRPDGMACFAGADGSLVLMRNHELPAGLRARLYGLPSSGHAYDPGAAGAVTRVVVDAQTLERRSSNLVLEGTAMSCAGGASPWGWLSCEESVDPGHGYVFLCDPSADSVRAPVRIDAFGRFRHEAAGVDAERGTVYLTEDRPDGCLYRFVPHDRAAPFEGRLSALAVRGRPGETTAPWTVGLEREIEWIDLDDPAPAQDVLRARAGLRGAATFVRGEGICVGGDVIFCASGGGPIGGGQIFRLEDEGEGGSLTVLASSTDREVLDMPDNVCLAPNGVVFFVEDGPGHDCLRGIVPGGEVFVLARNAASEGELSGVCFAPDGRAMFVNLQEEGLTLAITGDFERFA